VTAAGSASRTRAATGSFACPARAVSSSPTWSEALSAACVVAARARLEPMLPADWLVSTVSVGRAHVPVLWVAAVPVSAVAEEEKSAGTTSAPYSLPSPSSSFASFSSITFQSIPLPLAGDLRIDSVIRAPRLMCSPPAAAPLSALTRPTGSFFMWSTGSTLAPT
jgi:hypothetical protein